MYKNGANISKKDKERNILFSIYKKDDYAQIEDSEEPDFIICEKKDGNRFGVEVTELYYTETNARMKNLDNYCLDLLDGKDFKHKDDKKNIEIGFPKLIAENGEETEIKALVSHVLKLFEYLAKVRELIANKNNRVSSYNNELSHVNLIIADTERYFEGKQLTTFYSMFFDQEILEVILNSRFREIFFITTVEKNRKVYIPLKMLLFVSRYIQFKEFIEEEYNNISISSKKSIEIFCSCLSTQGFKGLKTIIRQDGHEIVFGSTGICPAIGQNTNVHMYNDNVIPKDAVLFKSDCNGVNNKIIKRFNKDVTESTFLGAVGFDVIGK